MGVHKCVSHYRSQKRRPGASSALPCRQSTHAVMQLEGDPSVGLESACSLMNVLNHEGCSDWILAMGN